MSDLDDLMNFVLKMTGVSKTDFLSKRRDNQDALLARRQFILNADLHGFSHEDIAEKIGRDRSTVAKILSET